MPDTTTHACSSFYLPTQNGALPDVRFNFPCRNNQLEVLYQSLRYAGTPKYVEETPSGKPKA